VFAAGLFTGLAHDTRRPKTRGLNRNWSIPGELYGPLQRGGLDRSTLGQRLILAQG
jgi:hypothetical protein